MRRYAEDTRVAIGRTRDQIMELLRRWGAEGAAWFDHWDCDEAELQFKFSRIDPGGKSASAYLARFRIKVEAEADIKRRCTGRRGFAQGRYDKEMADRGRREHRVLYLWLKAAFEAVEEKIIPVEAIFLPFLVAHDGRTVYETAIPLMPKLFAGTAARLLPEPRRES